MTRQLYLIREISPNVSKNFKPERLVNFKISNNIDRFGFSGGEDGEKEYRVLGHGWPVYVFVGTQEELQTQLSQKSQGEGGITICTQVPVSYITKKGEPASKKVELRLNEPFGHYTKTLDIQVEWDGQKLSYPQGIDTSDHDAYLLKKINEQEGGHYGEGVVYDELDILSFKNLPWTQIYQTKDGKTELVRTIEGQVLTEKELTTLTDHEKEMLEQDLRERNYVPEKIRLEPREAPMSEEKQREIAAIEKELENIRALIQKESSENTFRKKE
jgi:hypothetical protein